MKQNGYRLLSISTEPFVDGACQLLTGKDGVYVVGRSDITALKMS